MSLNPWHIIFIWVMVYLLWHFLALRKPGSKELTALKLNYVNFGMVLALGTLTFASLAYMYYPNGASFPKALLELAYIVWTISLSLILLRSDLHASIKIVGLPILLGAFSIHYLFKSQQTGLMGFLRNIDSFTSFSGGVGGAGVKLSIVLKCTFFFLNAFIILIYYGKVFEIVRQSRVKPYETGLEEEAIKRLILVLSVGVSLILALVLSGIDIMSLSLFSGLVAAGVSIALKDLLSNMAAGLLLLWDRSIKTKDVISLDKDHFGVVQSMTVRYLVIEDRNDIRFLVPNSELITKTITNWTQDTRQIRLKVDVGVAFDSDVSQVRAVMKDVCSRVSRVLQDPPPRVLILGFGDSAINFQLRFFINDPEMGVRNVMGEIYELLLAKFNEAGIRIPFPQREIRVVGDSTLDVNVLNEPLILKAGPL
jgi:small-conductance mechanosensitive channel